MVEEGGDSWSIFLFCFVWFGLLYGMGRWWWWGVFINWVGQLMNSPNYNLNK